jgi:hypothetical protein
LKAAAMNEDFTETDEKLGKDSKRGFNFMLRKQSHHWKYAQQGWIMSIALSEQISSSQLWVASLAAKTWLTSRNMSEQQNCILSCLCKLDNDQNDDLHGQFKDQPIRG